MISKTAHYGLMLTIIGVWLGSCTGEDGKDGAPGLTGARGADGPQGPQGPSGLPGPAGGAGPEGPEGPEGPQGPAGPRGPAGPPGSVVVVGAGGGDGEGGATSIPALTTSCLAPCHSFSGLVEQWKTSTHYSTYIANLGGEEVPTWTGNAACGNCHAIDGIEQRVAGNITYSGTQPPNSAHGQTNYLNSTNNKVVESNYAGHATVAVVHCSTCHETNEGTDPHLTGQNYTPGSFPLRVPSGPGDEGLLEKSSAVGVSDGTPATDYNRGNVCIWCHKSRKDVTNYIAPTNNKLSSAYWGPHEGPQSDVYTGKGGYHFPGKTYGNSSHQAFENGCLDCHMPRDANKNAGIGDHSFYPRLSSCQKAGCHANAKNFDVIGGQSAMRASIQELRVILNNRMWLTRSSAAPYEPLTDTQLADQHFEEDVVLPNGALLTGDEAGALYNYLLLARGSGGGIHNPVYVRELIYDSIMALTGNRPASIPARP